MRVREARRWSSWLLLPVLGAGCAASRTLAIEATPSARVVESHAGAVCAKTPCTWRFSRETCFGLDSSSGFFSLTATADDGSALGTPMLRTCGVAEGTTVRFRFASTPGAGDCGVDLLEPGKAGHWSCDEARSFAR